MQNGNTTPACPDCGGRLSRCQPDESRPRRLLGVCNECREWWLVSYPASRWLRDSPDPTLARVEVDAAPFA